MKVLITTALTLLLLNCALSVYGARRGNINDSMDRARDRFNRRLENVDRVILELRQAGTQSESRKQRESRKNEYVIVENPKGYMSGRYSR